MNISNHMSATIAAFEGGRLPFHALVGELEAAIGYLPDTQPEKNLLHEEWWTLEQVNAVMLDRKLPDLSSEHLTLVQNTLANFRHLLVNLAKAEDQCNCRILESPELNAPNGPMSN